MAHLRISSETIHQRAGGKPRTKEREYLFTQSRWQAIAYLSQGQTTIEGGFIDPRIVFSPLVMRNVDKAIAHGIECHVTQFNDLTGRSVGVLLILYIESYNGEGPRNVGYYALRYAKDAYLGDTQIDTPTQ